MSFKRKKTGKNIFLEGDEIIDFDCRSPLGSPLRSPSPSLSPFYISTGPIHSPLSRSPTSKTQTPVVLSSGKNSILSGSRSSNHSKIKEGDYEHEKMSFYVKQIEELTRERDLLRNKIEEIEEGKVELESFWKEENKKKDETIVQLTADVLREHAARLAAQEKVTEMEEKWKGMELALENEKENEKETLTALTSSRERNKREQVPVCTDSLALMSTISCSDHTTKSLNELMLMMRKMGTLVEGIGMCKEDGDWKKAKRIGM